MSIFYSVLTLILPVLSAYGGYRLSQRDQKSKEKRSRAIALSDERRSRIREEFKRVLNMASTYQSVAKQMYSLTEQSAINKDSPFAAAIHNAQQELNLAIIALELEPGIEMVLTKYDEVQAAFTSYMVTWNQLQRDRTSGMMHSLSSNLERLDHAVTALKSLMVNYLQNLELTT